MPARRTPFVAALILIASLVAASGHARGREIGPTVFVPAEVRAGSVVEIRWSELPAGVDECELLLSVDGGRRWVRISPELFGHSYEWKVPDLPASEARLRLRYGSRRGESEGPPSSPFRIHGAPAGGTTPRRSFFGQWWPLLEQFSRTTPVPEMERGETRFSPLESTPASDAPPRNAVDFALVALDLHTIRPADGANDPAPEPCVAPPRSMPLRN